MAQHVLQQCLDHALSIDDALAAVAAALPEPLDELVIDAALSVVTDEFGGASPSHLGAHLLNNRSGSNT